MVNLCNCKWTEFLSRIQNRQVFCFGSGELAKCLSRDICGQNICEHIIAFVDNDKKKVGSFIQIDEITIPIISYEEFRIRKTENAVVFITSMHYAAILKQMDNDTQLLGLDCYIEAFLEEEKEEVKKNELCTTEDALIPKIIHYCWFGKQKIPSIYEKYMDSWKKYCPDYKIMCWSEDNYDYTQTDYTKEAYEAKKWAFVSDYARLDVVYKYGGIYLDTDVEIAQNLDSLRRNCMFCGFEKFNYINTGLGFGAIPGFLELRRMRDFYKGVHFKRNDGTMNLTACTTYQTDYLVKRGLKRNGRIQVVNGIKILPRTVLAPIDFYGLSDWKSDETYTVHHYAATWFDKSGDRSALLQANCKIKARMGELGKNDECFQNGRNSER